MMNACFPRVHRHTRPAAYMDRSRQARQARAQRPGASGFSFTGEFPEVEYASTPVEAASRRRQYTSASADTGAYRALGDMDAVRTPAITRYGVQLHTALVMIFALLVVLGCVWVNGMAETSAVSKHISQQQTRIEELTIANADAKGQIAARCNDVSIRKEAVRLGLISSKGVDVIYLTAPDNAIITPANTTAAQVLVASAGN